MLKSICQTTLFFLVVSVLGLSGCSKSDKPEGFPVIYPCKIKVIQDGTPLVGANVVLMGDPPWAVGGGTDDTGVATIHTHGKYVGAPAGKYQVLITKNVKEGAEKTEEQRNDPSYVGGGITTYNTVSKQFGFQVTTPLEIEVKSGVNSETFDVGKAVKEEVPRLGTL